MASDLMFAVNVFDTLALCPGINGAVECGIVKSDESLEDWATRNDIECFGTLLALYSDSLGAGPSSKQHAGYALKSRSYFLLLPLLQSLVAGGALKNPMMPPRGKTLAALAADPKAQMGLFGLPPNSVFKQGYDGFWNLFVDVYKLNVRKSDQVTRVSPRNGKLSLTTANSGPADYDHVVIAVAPVHSKVFLPNTYAPFWKNVKQGSVESTAWLVNPTPDSKVAHLTEPGVALYPQICEVGLGRPTGLVYDGTVYSMSLEKGGVYITLALPTVGAEPAAGVLKQLEDLNIDVQNGGDYVKIKSAVWPNYVDGSDFGHWHEGVKQLQGKGQVSFVGEVLAGNNVPAIMDDTVAHFVSGAWQGERH